MAAAILQMSAAIGAGVVAEGVETESEAATLIDLRYTVGQGYLFAKAMPIDALNTRVVREERLAALVGRESYLSANGSTSGRRHERGAVSHTSGTS